MDTLEQLLNTIPICNCLEITDMYFKLDNNVPININRNLININITFVNSYNNYLLLVNYNIKINDLINYIQNEFTNDRLINKLIYYGIELDRDNTILDENILNNSILLVILEGDDLNNIIYQNILNINQEYINNEGYQINNDGTVEIGFNNLFSEIFELEENNINSTLTLDEVNNKYPILTYNSQLNNDIKCPICFNNIINNEEIRKTSCDHIYHKECIDKWLIEFNNSCPICKKIL